MLSFLEQDRWWEAVMANEDLRSQCRAISEKYHLSDAPTGDGRTFSTLPRDVKQRWEELGCNSRRTRASSLSIADSAG